MLVRASLLAGYALTQLALTGGSLASAQGVAAAASPCSSATLCDGGALGTVAAKLRMAERGERQVHILQIGDSHTAGDMITNGLRRRLQEKYGNGGRGVLAAGTPYRGYLTFGVTASETPGWRSNVIFGSRWQPEGPALGLSGFTRTARTAGEWLALTTDSPEFNFNRAILCALTGPGQGSVMIRMGDEEESWSLDAPAPGAECKTLVSRQPISSASVTTLGDAPVSITSFGTFRNGSGVIVSNVGVVGAQLEHFGRTDDQVLAREFAAYRPDMIVLAFGTNEGFGSRLSSDAYEAVLRQQVTRIRRFAGRDVPIMLLGAPDAASRSAAVGASCGSGAFTPGALGEVRAVQRRVARELGLGFWDWEQAMGGRCAAQAWVNSGLMRSDLVHFTREGGDRIGAMIFEDLERARPSALPPSVTRTLPVAPARDSAIDQAPSPSRRLTHPGQPLESGQPVRRRPD
jgi:lysophospholipase L1-like esterase